MVSLCSPLRALSNVFLYFSELIFLPFFKSDLFAFGSKANKSVTQTTLVVQIWLRPLYFETSIGLPTTVHIRLKGKLSIKQESNVKPLANCFFALDSCLIYSLL